MTQLAEATLQEICNLVTDGTHDTPITLDSGVPFIKAKQITNGFIDFANCEFISYEDHLKVISRSKPEKGDTLFTHIGASLGAAAFIDTEEEFSIKNIALFKPNPQKITPRYLYYLVINHEFQNGIKNRRTGSAQPFVSLDILRTQPIRYIENIPIQRRIAEILSAYDDLIEVNTRRIRILEGLAQSVYREWFGKVDEESMPDGWQVGKLEDALVLQRGFDLPTQDRHEGDVPIFASTGITGTHNVAKVKAPGVVTGRSGSLGTVIYVDKDYWPLNTTLWVKEFRRVTPLFAYYLLRDLKLEQFNSGVAVPTLNRNDVHGMPVVIPPREFLEKFDEFVLPMHSLMATLRKKNVNLRQTRDLLLPRLVGGEVNGF